MIDSNLPMEYLDQKPCRYSSAAEFRNSSKLVKFEINEEELAESLQHITETMRHNIKEVIRWITTLPKDVEAFEGYSALQGKHPSEFGFHPVGMFCVFLLQWRRGCPFSLGLPCSQQFSKKTVAYILGKLLSDVAQHRSYPLYSKAGT